jgi:hypothetical protein
MIAAGHDEALRQLFEHDLMTVPRNRRTPTEATFKRTSTGRYARSDIEQQFELFCRGYRVGRAGAAQEPKP